MGCASRDTVEPAGRSRGLRARWRPHGVLPLLTLSSFPWASSGAASAAAAAATGASSSSEALMFQGVAGSGDALRELKVERNVSSGEAPQVRLEVYYLTTCPHCADFLRRAMLPVVDAGLPEDQVQIMFLPVLKGMSSPERCMATDACRFALTPLCAWRDVRTAADHQEALQHAARFVACDIQNTAGGLGRDRQRTEDCATHAGLEWEGEDGLKACSEGPEAFGVMYSPDYANQAIAAMHRLREEHWQKPPDMPWVFLNEELLRCDGEHGACSAWMEPEGDRMLKEPSSLLGMVCGRLRPRPSMCDKALSLDLRIRSSSTTARPTQPAPACESCVEVGAFHWYRHPSSRGFPLPRSSPVAAAAAVAALGLTLLFAFAAWRSSALSSCRGMLATCAEVSSPARPDRPKGALSSSGCTGPT